MNISRMVMWYIIKYVKQMIHKNNQAGFSLTEILVSMAILGGVTLGVTHLLKNSSQDAAKLSTKLDLKSLINEISREFLKSEVCSAQFAGQPIINPNISTLKSGEKVLLQLHSKVLNNKYEVDQIESSKLDRTKFNLRVTFKDVKTNINRVEDFAVAAELNENENLIVRCYGENDNLQITEGMCQGPGVIFKNGVCNIKNFERPFKTCAQGESFKGISEVESENYKVECGLSNMKESNCPNNMIKQYNASGEIECLDFNQFVSSDNASVTAGANCGLEVVENKLKFSCH